MKKNIIKSLAMLMMMSAGYGLTSCSDVDAINDLVLSRVLAPTGMKAQVYENDTNLYLQWDQMTGATQYEIQCVPTDGTEPIVEVITADPSATSYEIVLPGMPYETTYNVRIRAIDGNDSSRNSKWMEKEVTTYPQQNMKTVKDADIESKSVTVKWSQGVPAVKVILQKSSKANPFYEESENDKVYELTEDDKAACSATITGLSGESTYNVYIRNAENKTVGYGSVTTAINVDNAIIVNTGDVLQDAINNAEAGAILMLAPGEYGTEGAIKITKDITLVSKDTKDRAILRNTIQIWGSANVSLFRVNVNGQGASDQFVVFKRDAEASDSEFYDINKLDINGCEIYNFGKGLIYINELAHIKDLKINNCYIHDIECAGGDMIDARKGGWDNLLISNSTIANSCASRDVIRFDAEANGNLGGLAPRSEVTKCTFYNVGTGHSTRQLFYVRYAGNTNIFTNNVVAGYTNKRGFSAQSATSAPSFDNNYYFECLNLTSLEEGSTESAAETIKANCDHNGTVLEVSPFKDAASNDFTLINQEMQNRRVGDPRWQE